MSTRIKRVRFCLEDPGLCGEQQNDGTHSSSATMPYFIMAKVTDDPSASIRAKARRLELIDQGAIRLKKGIPLQWKRVEKVVWRAKSLGIARGIDKELENIEVTRSLGTHTLALYIKGIEGHDVMIQRIKANLDWTEAELKKMVYLLSAARPDYWRNLRVVLFRV